MSDDGEKVGTDDQKQPPVRRSRKSRKAPRRKSPASAPQRKRGPNKVSSQAWNRKHPWEEIKVAYVEGLEDGKDVHLPNLKELSDRFGVPYQSIRSRSSNERWPEQRNQYQLNITRERQRKRAMKLAADAGEFDENAHQTARLGISMVLARLAEIAKESQVRKPFREEAMERLARGEPVEKEELYSAVYHRELEGLASAASRFQEIGMKALGTDAQKIELSGPEGGAIEHNVSVVEELRRDDPERLAQLIMAMEQSGLTPHSHARLEALRSEEEEDAVVVEDTDESEAG